MADDASQPRNLEGVFRMAVENSSNDEAIPTTQPMNDERRQFIQGVLSSISGASPVERVKVIVSHCLAADDYDRDLLYDELEELAEWCEDIDVACDFHKVGGFVVFDVLQKDSDEGLRWRCGEIIAALCQNNPYCQEKLLSETEQIDRLIAMAGCVTESELVRTKALYALSGFLRGNTVCQEKFVVKDGFSLLLKAMQHGGKICTKASFLLMTLMRDHQKYKDDLARMGYVEQLVVILNGDHQADHEHVMAALLELTTECKSALTEALRPELCLQQLLDTRISLIHNLPESEEELDYAQRLKTLLDGAVDENEVER